MVNITAEFQINGEEYYLVEAVEFDRHHHITDYDYEAQNKRVNNLFTYLVRAGRTHSGQNVLDSIEMYLLDLIEENAALRERLAAVKELANVSNDTPGLLPSNSPTGN
jgi:hypothetical protein